MKDVNILLVDDEDLLRQGLRALLEKEPFVKNIYEAGDAEEFYVNLEKYPIDIILLDIKLPGTKGNQLMEELNKSEDRPKVIAVTGLDGVELTINLLKSGVNGIVFKLDGYRVILNTIHQVMENGSFFQEKTLKIIQNNLSRWDQIPTISLSFIENAVIRGISNGLTTKAIASELKMTEATTETYRNRLMKKLNTPNTAAMLAYAYRNGIL